MLSPRKQQVLKAVIQAYVVDGLPVGSRTLSKDSDLGVSPATIRNEMADLEDLGLLTQPHTSAGRVPTDKGYRLFVDNLMSVAVLDAEDIEKIEFGIKKMISDKERMVSTLAEIIAEMTHYATIFSGPDVAAWKLHEFTILPINEMTVLAVMIVNNGLTAQRTIRLSQPLRVEELEFINRILNYGFKGKYLNEVSLHERQLILDTISSYLICEHSELKSIIDQMLDIDIKTGITNHAINMAFHPEFMEGDRYLRLLQTLSTEELLMDLLNIPGDVTDQLQILIGSEMDNEAMQECSIVRVNYFVDDRPAGTIGVIGPKRMYYSKVAALLNYVAKRLQESLK